MVAQFDNEAARIAGFMALNINYLSSRQQGGHSASCGLPQLPNESFSHEEHRTDHRLLRRPRHLLRQHPRRHGRRPDCALKRFNVPYNAFVLHFET